MRVLWFLTLVLCLQGQTPPPRVGVSVSQTRLSLPEAVQLALKNNLEIEIEKTNQATAYAAVRGAKGFLDPLIRWQPFAETRNTPTGNSLASSTGKVTENTWSQNFYYRQRLPWQGMSLHADFENPRLSTNNPFTSLNPYITPRLVLGASLPLLRGRETDSERADLTIRRKNATASDADFEFRVIDVIARVEQGYYDLVAVRADLQVVNESVALAQEQLDRTRRMIDSGSVAPVELSAAVAELERRKDNYFTSLALLTQAENALKSLLAGGREEEVWRDELVPTTNERAQTPAPAGSDLRSLVSDALSRRVELRLIALRKDVNEVQRQLAQNQRKVRLDLTGSFYTTGLAGSLLLTENPFSGLTTALADRTNQLSAIAGLPPISIGNVGGGGVPKDFVGGYGQSLSNLFSGRYPTVQGGLNLEWTPRNNAAESAISQAAIVDRRIGLQRRQMEQNIEAQIRNALQGISSSEQRIAAAEASARAAREKLESETRLFQTGESTNFLVLTRQNEFSDARRRAVVATLEFNRSVARLEFALGKTLEEYKIKLK